MGHDQGRRPPSRPPAAPSGLPGARAPLPRASRALPLRRRPAVAPRDGAIILGDLVGKLDMLHVECPKCGRAGDVASTAGVMPWPPGWSLPDNSGQNSILARDGLSAYDPGRVKTRSVLFVGGVSGDPGGIVRLGAANSAELVRADA